jgi:beta-phosphoglucomutase
MRPSAVIFDFNGTLSDDEPILCEIFQELFAANGRPLSAQEYYDELAGLSDPEVIRTWLGPEHPAVDAVLAERIRRYQAVVADGSSVPQERRHAVHYAAERAPVALVSGAARAEIEPVLEATGLAAAFSAVVTADDVERGKPNPEGYLRALELLDGGVRAGDLIAFEDTEAGVAAAKGAGMRVVALAGTVDPSRLCAAEEIVERIDVVLLERLFE